MKKYLLLFTVLFVNLVFSQQVVGVVLDSKLNKFLANVNITVLNSNLGVSSNNQGEFILNKEIIHSNDSLQFSHIGYLKKKISVRDLKSDEISTVFLEPLENKLDEVVIKTNTEQFGAPVSINMKKRKTGAVFLAIDKELIVFIDNPNKKRGQLFSLDIFLKKHKEFESYKPYPVTFLINFYKVDDFVFKPEGLLSDSGIVITPENKSYVHTINLKDKGIEFPKNGLFVGLKFTGSLLDKSTRYKYTSAPGLLSVKTNKTFTFSRTSNGRLHPPKFSLSKKVSSYSPLLNIKAVYPVNDSE